jgi:hypothetical protein
VPSAQCPHTEILGQSQVVVLLATFSRKLSKLVKLIKFLQKKKKCQIFPNTLVKNLTK